MRPSMRGFPWGFFGPLLLLGLGLLYYFWRLTPASLGGGGP